MNDMTADGKLFVIKKTRKILPLILFLKLSIILNTNEAVLKLIVNIFIILD